MREERGAAHVDAIQTFVEPVREGDSEILVDHWSSPSRWIKTNGDADAICYRGDQLPDGQQFEHFEPGNLGFAVGQALAPECPELKFIPEPTGQPAIAEDAWALECQ